MSNLSNWSNDDLMRRWDILSEKFVNLTNNLKPLIIELSKIENELIILKNEILNRGLNNEKKE